MNDVFYSLRHPVVAVFIGVLSIVSADGQLPGQWLPLPPVDSTKAYSYQWEPTSKTTIIDTTDYRLEEVLTKDRFKFSSIIVPDTVEITFSSYPLLKSETISVSNGMLFKDNSTHNIKYLDKVHGLPSNHINALAQDRKGRIYLGMHNGLAIFNGNELEVYKGHLNFSFNEIRSLMYDSRNRLWLATSTGVCYIKDGKIFVPDNSPFGATHLKGFNENEQTGEVFIFTFYNGLFIEKEGTFTHYGNQLPIKAVSSAFRASDHKLWFSFSYGGAGFIDGDSLFLMTIDGVNRTPRTVFEWKNEVYIGYFRAPLKKYRNDSIFTLFYKGETFQNNYSFDSNEQGLWMVNYGSGVCLITPDHQVFSFKEQHGLAGNISFALMIDPFDNVWVADPAYGVSRIDANIFYPYPKKVGYGIISDMEIDNQNHTWYFKSGGLPVKISGNTYITYDGGGNYAQSGLILNNEIWMADADMGLTKSGSGTFTSYSMKENIEYDSTIYNIQKDQEGNIWGWNLGNNLYKFRNGYFFNYSNAPEWHGFQFNGLKKAGNTLYALTENQGIIAIREGQYLYLSKKQGLLSNSVSHVVEDSNSNVWLCMDGHIQLYTPAGKSYIISISSLINNPLNDLLEISKNDFLGTTEKGVLHIQKQGDSLVNYTLYDAQYGSNLIGNNLIKKDGEGNIVIAGGNKTLTYDPNFLKKNITRPLLSLNRIELNGNIYPVPEGTLEINQKTSIRFVFNNIYWGKTSTLFYQLKKDTDPIKWNKAESHSISFNELPHGVYHLNVKSGDGRLESNILTYSFEILPFWYQTSLFKSGVFAFITMIFTTYLISREKLAQKRQQKLQQIVNDKTLQLQVEKENVSKQLAEKEMLLQEIHHRVKNNLTFLQSLFYLRSKATTDENTKQILSECQAQIKSIALVHQNLYGAQNISEIDFKIFLEELFVEIKTLFSKNHVSILINSHKLMLDIKFSMFLGLILNELITNSFKYAFSDKAKAQISVELQEDKDHYLLHYADNGIGLPKGFNFNQSTGFGFKIIRILLDQINGKLSYNHIQKKYTLRINKK